jgi:sugar phosphate isomerase/epimerase
MPVDNSSPARLVLAAGSVLDATVEQLVDIAATAGFAGVGLRPGAELLEDHRRLTALRRRAEDSGVWIHDLEVIRIGPETEASLAGRLIEAACVLDAHAVLVVSDLIDPAATVDQLARIAQDCRSAGVVAGLEYMAWTMPASPIQAAEFAERTGAVVVVDVLHHHRVGAGIAEMRSVVSSGRLGWVQVCDAAYEAPPDLLHEARHDRLLPGQGELALADLLSQVPAETIISVEVQSDRLAAEMDAPARARMLHRAASELMQNLLSRPR